MTARLFLLIDRIGDNVRWKSGGMSPPAEVAEIMGLATRHRAGQCLWRGSGRLSQAAPVWPALIVQWRVWIWLSPARPCVDEGTARLGPPTVFLRIHQEDPSEHTTGTLELKKTDLVAERLGSGEKSPSRSICDDTRSGPAMSS